MANWSVLSPQIVGEIPIRFYCVLWPGFFQRFRLSALFDWSQGGMFPLTVNQQLAGALRAIRIVSWTELGDSRCAGQSQHTPTFLNARNKTEYHSGRNQRSLFLVNLSVLAQPMNGIVFDALCLRVTWSIIGLFHASLVGWNSVRSYFALVNRSQSFGTVPNFPKPLSSIPKPQPSEHQTLLALRYDNVPSVALWHQPAVHFLKPYKFYSYEIHNHKNETICCCSADHWNGLQVAMIIWITDPNNPFRCQSWYWCCHGRTVIFEALGSRPGGMSDLTSPSWCANGTAHHRISYLITRAMSLMYFKCVAKFMLSGALKIWMLSLQATARESWTYLGIAQNAENHATVKWIDLWGTAVFTDLVKELISPFPAYDDGETVYTDTVEPFGMLIWTCQNPLEKPGADDLIFGGDDFGWRKLATPAT